MKQVLEGRALRLKHSICIKDICPESSLSSSDPEEIRSRLLKDYIPDSFSELKEGDILVAGRCFGSGPYYPEAIEALRQSGIGCVAAISFGRQFFRDAVNRGLPVIEQQDLFGKVRNGDILTIDFGSGEIRFRKEILRFESYPEPLGKIMEAGGLIPFIRTSSSKNPD
jgi:3-isopropylmalate/(R)-2-methylmalate dehydratase small subunit